MVTSLTGLGYWSPGAVAMTTCAILVKCPPHTACDALSGGHGPRCQATFRPPVQPQALRTRRSNVKAQTGENSLSLSERSRFGSFVYFLERLLERSRQNSFSLFFSTDIRPKHDRRTDLVCEGPVTSHVSRKCRNVVVCRAARRDTADASTDAGAITSLQTDSSPAFKQSGGRYRWRRHPCLCPVVSPLCERHAQKKPVHGEGPFPTP